MGRENTQDVIDYAKQEILLALYESLERMNAHMLDSNVEGVTAERYLQCNLRNNFRELEDRQGLPSDL